MDLMVLAEIQVRSSLPDRQPALPNARHAPSPTVALGRKPVLGFGLHGSRASLQSVSSIDAAVGEQAFAGGDEDAGGERVNRSTDLVRRREGWGDTEVAVGRTTALGKGR